MSEARTLRTGGKVRAARLTDLAALGELSRLCQDADSSTRSLGLPVSVIVAVRGMMSRNEVCVRPPESRTVK